MTMRYPQRAYWAASQRAMTPAPESKPIGIVRADCLNKGVVVEWISHHGRWLSCEILGVCKADIVVDHDHNTACLEPRSSRTPTDSDGPHLVYAVFDEFQRVTVDSRSRPKRRLERFGSVDNQRTSRNSCVTIMVDVLMVSLKIALPVLYRLSMFCHDRLDFYRNLHCGRATLQDRDAGIRLTHPELWRSQHQIDVPVGGTCSKNKVDIVDDATSSSLFMYLRAVSNQILNNHFSENIRMLV